MYIQDNKKCRQTLLWLCWVQLLWLHKKQRKKLKRNICPQYSCAHTENIYMCSTITWDWVWLLLLNSQSRRKYIHVFNNNLRLSLTYCWIHSKVENIYVFNNNLRLSWLSLLFIMTLGLSKDIQHHIFSIIYSSVDSFTSLFIHLLIHL